MYCFRSVALLQGRHDGRCCPIPLAVSEYPAVLVCIVIESCGRWRSRTACSPKHFRESSPLWSDAVALVSAMVQAFPYSNFACLRQLFRLLPSKYAYPDFSLLKTSELHSGLGSVNILCLITSMSIGNRCCNKKQSL